MWQILAVYAECTEKQEREKKSSTNLLFHINSKSHLNKNDFCDIFSLIANFWQLFRTSIFWW